MFSERWARTSRCVKPCMTRRTLTLRRAISLWSRLTASGERPSRRSRFSGAAAAAVASSSAIVSATPKMTVQYAAKAASRLDSQANDPPGRAGNDAAWIAHATRRKMMSTATLLGPQVRTTSRNNRIASFATVASPRRARRTTPSSASVHGLNKARATADAARVEEAAMERLSTSSSGRKSDISCAWLVALDVWYSFVCETKTKSGITSVSSQSKNGDAVAAGSKSVPAVGAHVATPASHTDGFKSALTFPTGTRDESTALAIWGPPPPARCIASDNARMIAAVAFGVTGKADFAAGGSAMSCRTALR